MEFDIQAPEKSTYKFNEVTSITGVKPYVLRFWESEFDIIKPKKKVGLFGVELKRMVLQISKDGKRE